MDLNTDQLKAIKHGGGPLLIIAGAGTGKTTVITERIKHLISSGIANSSEILALTFTEKAAAEMQTRVDQILPLGYGQLDICTFHKFCDQVLRAEALEIGLTTNFKLLTTAESVRLLRENIFDLDLDYYRPLGNPTKFVFELLTHFSRLQDEDISPNEYLKWSKNQPEEKYKELAQAFQKYDELKIKKSFMDFGDLITKTLLLFRIRPNVLKSCQKKYKYILIDEFQDTNFAQNELALLLAGSAGNITVVGDDDQAIYRFRGAAISNILGFKSHFKNVSTVVLSKNYRSCQEILDSAYRAIAFNNPDRLEVTENINKRLIAMKKGKGEIGFIHVGSVEDEAEEVVEKIKSLVEKKYQYKDIAILVRANAHADPFIKALYRANIPHQFLGPGKLLESPEILDLVAYLKLIYNFEDNASLMRVLSINHFGIPQRELVKLGNIAREENAPLFSLLTPIHLEKLDQEVAEKILNIQSLLDSHIERRHIDQPGQLLYEFVADTGILEGLLKSSSESAEVKAKNISKFFDKLKAFETNGPEVSIENLVDWLELSAELGESPRAAEVDWQEENAVNILTVHGSKGLEFPVVFLVNLVAERFPTRKRGDVIPIPDELIKESLPEGDYHLEEERRLFYVGLTRAQDKVFLTAANYYGEGVRQKRLSPFITEALGDQKTTHAVIPHLMRDPDLRTKPSVIKKIPKVHVDYLSYSQIETFRICPLHYKLKYILGIPTPPSSSQSFGNSFHATMKNFYEEIENGKKPTVKLVHNLLEKNWINKGYLNKKHEQESLEKAKRFLEHFLKEDFDPKVQPIALEQPFNINVGNIRMGGKIDRIDKKTDSLHIVDYKTGSTVMSQREADKALQLSIYALAASEIKTPPFGVKPENIKLSLMYFEDPQIITTVRTKDDLETAKSEILEIRKQIEESDFKCSGNFLCSNCEYKSFCREVEVID